MNAMPLFNVVFPKAHILTVDLEKDKFLAELMSSFTDADYSDFASVKKAGRYVATGVAIDAAIILTAGGFTRKPLNKEVAEFIGNLRKSNPSVFIILCSPENDEIGNLLAHGTLDDYHKTPADPSRLLIAVYKFLYEHRIRHGVKSIRAIAEEIENIGFGQMVRNTTGKGEPETESESVAAIE